MDIHKPKPVHSFREFLSEIGVIVLGVLIALAAEQIVEDLHWRHEAQAAREALYAEAADRLNSAVSRQNQQACMDRRLEEIAVIFEDQAEGRPLKVRGHVGRPVFYSGAEGAWQVEVGGQALTHMAMAEKLRFSEAFSSYANMKEALLREQDAWLPLGMLDRPEILQAADWPVLHRTFAEASAMNGRLQVIVDRILAHESLGQHPRAVPPPLGIQIQLKTLCSPI